MLEWIRPSHFLTHLQNRVVSNPYLEKKNWLNYDRLWLWQVIECCANVEFAYEG